MGTDRINIVLTGFMGTGKSIIGRQLAYRTGRTFVDLDEEIIKIHGPIAGIFEEGGEDLFRRLEREAVNNAAARRNLVVATGGGTFTDDDNVVAFLGSQIYTLTATPAAIAERVASDGIQSRPLLADADDLEGEIQRLLDERSETYERFTAIETTDRSVEEVIDAIAAAGADVTEPPPTSTTSSRDNREVALYGVIALLVVLAIALLIVVLSF